MVICGSIVPALDVEPGQTVEVRLEPLGASPSRSSERPPPRRDPRRGAAAGADALWVHPGVDFRFLTGRSPLALERPTALVVPAGGGERASWRCWPAELAPLGDVAAWRDGDGRTPRSPARRTASAAC